jgi:hypothetical protein
MYVSADVSKSGDVRNSGTFLFIPLPSSIVVAAIVWRYLVCPDYWPVSRMLGFLNNTCPTNLICVT